MAAEGVSCRLTLARYFGTKYEGITRTSLQEVVNTHLPVKLFLRLL